MSWSHFWHELYPQVFAVAFVAGVIGNLVASVIWATPVFLNLHRKLNARHLELMEAHSKLLESHRQILEAVKPKPDTDEVER